jgi:hypothetical protein
MGKYPYTVAVQFKLHGEGLGDLNGLEFRHSLEGALGTLLEVNKLGMCDGGQQGAGTAEVFLFTNDIEKTVEIIKQELSRRELLSFCKIASYNEDPKGWITHYSLHGNFDAWKW